MPVPNIPDLDLAAPTGRENGRPYWTVRCRVPMAFDASFRDVEVRDVRPAATSRAEPKMPPDGEDMPHRPTGSGPMLDGPVIEGIASSTGIDSYGTEMSEAALEDMAGQFRGRGVVYLPQHPGFFSGGGEWDDVMGYVVDAEILRGEVPSAADAAEPGFLLRVKVQLDAEHPKTEALAKKLRAGHVIGQSIGGWFTKLRFVYPDGVDPEEAMAGWIMPDRVIVEGVELDHLAATRAPANRESYIEGVRTALREQAQRTKQRGEAARATQTATPAKPPATGGAKGRGENQHPDAMRLRTEATAPVDTSGAVPHVPEAAVTRTAAPATRDAMDAPAYRPQTSGSSERCDRCAHYKPDEAEGSAGGQCTKFEFLTRGEYTCDDWAEDPARPTATEEDLAARAPEQRKAAPYAELPKAPDDTPWEWDATAQDEVLGDPPDWERYKAAHAWFDPEQADQKDGYKLPVAKVVDGELRLVWNGVSAAMAALNGARGGVDIPDEDREPVYRLLSRYYADFDKEAPPLRSAADASEIAARSNSGLDTEAAAAHDASVNPQVGSDAHRGAPADTATKPSTEERSMPDTAQPTDAERLAAIERSLALLTAKLAPATDATPVTPAETPEQRRIRELEAQLSTVLSEPQRRGVVPGHFAPHEAATGIDALLAEADTQGRARGIVAVTRSGRVHRTLTEADGPAKVTKGDVEYALRAVLAAGVSDGLVAEPNEFVSWGGQ